MNHPEVNMATKRISIIFISLALVFLFLFSPTAFLSTAFSSGQSAVSIEGQTAFTSDVTNPGGVSASYLDNPGEIALNSSGGLWVADYGNNRVLEFSTLASSEPATIAIGQTSLNNNGCNAGGVSASTLCHPDGVALDSSGNLWIADYSNDRVMEFKEPFSTGESASLVLGQTSFSGDSCNAGGLSASTLCGPTYMAFDSSGNLWVLDSGNNRALEFTYPFTTGEAASKVIGQPGFGTNSCNEGGLSASSLCTENNGGISLDGSGNLWISDYSNNRILEFPVPLSTDENATVVIGQADFIQNNCGSASAFVICDPEGLAFDSLGNLWASDWKYNRVLEYQKGSGFIDNESASLVLGQAGFSGYGSSCNNPVSPTSLCDPTDVAFDLSGNLWVADSGYNRMLRYSPVFSSDEAASLIEGQTAFTSDVENPGGVSASYLETIGHSAMLAFDGSGNLWVSDNYNNRILMFSTPLANGEAASVVIGQPNFTQGSCGSASATVICYPTGLAFDAQGNLWAADWEYNRVLEFSSPFSNGEAASVVLGRASFSGYGGTCPSTSSNSLCDPQGLAFDSSQNLWVADSDNNRIVAFNSPLTTNETESTVIGQTNFANSGCNQGGISAATLCLDGDGSGIAFDSNGNLWVGDYLNNRVLEFKAPLSTGESASLVLGQTSFSGDSCNAGGLSASSLCGPTFVAFDSSGNLWVSDYGNNRLLEFTTPFSTGESASKVIGQTSFSVGSCNQNGLSASSLCDPSGMTFDSQGNLWLLDSGNNRVLGYQGPISPPPVPDFPLGNIGMLIATILAVLSYGVIRFSRRYRKNLKFILTL